MFTAATRSARTARRQLRNVGIATSLAIAIGASAGAAPASAGVLRSCPSVAGIGIGANYNTSCPFAKNIARAFDDAVSRGDIDPYSHTSARGHVYSPVTGRTYSLRCTHLSPAFDGDERWGCRGGSSAYVRLVIYS